MHSERSSNGSTLSKIAESEEITEEFELKFREDGRESS